MRKSALYLFGLVVMLLVTLGLVVLSSASQANAMRLHHGDAYFFMKRQFIYLGIGLVAMVVTACFDYRRLRDNEVLAWVFYIGVFLALLAVFPPLGRKVNGSFRWLFLGPVSLQPSEFAKLAIVILLSVWLDKSGWRVELFRRGALWPFVLICILVAPVVAEPDFGSTLVIMFAGLLVMFTAGVRILHLLVFFGAGLLAVAGFVITNPNRMARIAAWLGFKLETGAAVADKAADAAGYQVYNALVAIGNGGIWGKGLGESMQKHLYLPEAHTDFILAVGAEELGLFFSIGVILLFCLFYGLSVYVAAKAEDRFGRFLVVGFSSLVFAQAMANVGVVCEAFPTKGLALPFFSYGGSNMISAFIVVGFVLSVGIHSYRDRKRSYLRSVVLR